MKNFIFKSEADFHKIVFNKLNMLLDEQKHQRCDLDVIYRMLTKVINSANLQRQVDDYFEDKDEDIPEKVEDKHSDYNWSSVPSSK